MDNKKSNKTFSNQNQFIPKNPPYVSVVIITRNRVKILTDCLEKLEQQTYQNFETIVVDSSNNFDTQELMKIHPKVIYLSIWDGRNNMGRHVLNGVYIAYMETDYGERAMTKIAYVK